MEFKTDMSSPSILLSDIPTTMDDVPKLATHFEKFGKILNVHNRYKNNPHAAVITFSKIEEAQAALNSWTSVPKMQYIRMDPVDSASNSVSSTSRVQSSIASLASLIPSTPTAQSVSGRIRSGNKERKRAPRKSFLAKFEALKDKSKKSKEKYDNVVKEKDEVIRKLKLELKCMYFLHCNCLLITLYYIILSIFSLLAKNTELKKMMNENLSLKKKINQIAGKFDQ